MKNIVSIYIFVLIVIIVISVITTNDSFAIERPLKIEDAKVVDIKGVFTLILYGGRHIDDIETIAILDCEGDEYTFEPYAPEFDYKIKKGISDREALNEAEKFVSFHNSFYRSQLSRIIDKKGNTIGYELRPLYLPFVFGVSDVMEVDYWLKEGGRVKVNIKLIQSVERLRYPGAGDASRDGGK